MSDLTEIRIATVAAVSQLKKANLKFDDFLFSFRLISNCGLEYIITVTLKKGVFSAHYQTMKRGLGYHTPIYNIE